MEANPKRAAVAVHRATVMCKIMMALSVVVALCISVFSALSYGGAAVAGQSLPQSIIHFEVYGVGGIVCIWPVVLMHITISAHSSETVKLKQKVADLRRSRRYLDASNDLTNDVNAITTGVHDLRIHLEATSKSSQSLLMSYFVIVNVSAYMFVVMAYFYVDALSHIGESTMLSLVLSGASLLYSAAYVVLYAWLSMRLARVSTDLHNLQMSLSDLCVECMYVNEM